MTTRELSKRFYESFDDYCNQQNSCNNCPLDGMLCTIISKLIDTLSSKDM